jgi:putative sigma-54 modulation protein
VSRWLTTSAEQHYVRSMKLAIHAHQLLAPRDVTAFLRKHVVAPLRRLHDSPATQLTVLVEDAKPGRGGVDRACKLTFHMPGARTLRVESVKDDLHAALLDCAQRLRRLVQREVDKQRSTSRAPQHRPLGRTWRQKASRSGISPDGTPSTL